MKTSLFVAGLFCLALAGCGAPHPSSERVAAGTPPAVTDSLVKLMRKSLTDPDPHATAQAMMCEIDRLFLLLGEKEAVQRIEEAEEIAFTWRDRAAIARRDSLLHLHSFSTSECRNTPHPDTAVASP